MGTRSLTFVYSELTRGSKAVPIINMYRQYDGYPSGHGMDLANFLGSGSMTNGLRLGADEKFFNGMGCLAAQLVAHFKSGAGNIYLEPVTATDCGQDYEYHIYYEIDELNNARFRIKVFNCGCNMFGLTTDDTYEPIFDGLLPEFLEFCREKETA